VKLSCWGIYFFNYARKKQKELILEKKPRAQKSSQALQTVADDKAELDAQKCIFRKEKFYYSSFYLTGTTSCEFL